MYSLNPTNPTIQITHEDEHTVIFEGEKEVQSESKRFVCRAIIDENGKTNFDQPSGDLAEIAAGNRYMLYLGKETKPGLVTVKFHLTLNKDLLTKDSEIKLEIYEVLTSTAFVVTKVSENKVVRCISHVNTTHEEIILTTIYVQPGQYLVFNTSEFLNNVSAWFTLTYV